MDIAESATWLEGLFDGDMELHETHHEKAATPVLATFQQDDVVICATVGFNEVDTGLESAGMDVRCELVTQTRASTSEAMRLLDAATQMLVRSNGVLTAQPGTLLPGVGDVIELPEHITVRHGLLMSPFQWGPQVPQVIEDDRWTLLLQLLMLTEEEFHYCVTYGPEELLEEMAHSAIDLSDWSRVLEY